MTFRPLLLQTGDAANPNAGSENTNDPFFLFLLDGSKRRSIRQKRQMRTEPPANDFLI